MKRGVAYARVSKSDESQNPENQLIKLREWAKVLDIELVQEYVDHESGGSSQRENFWVMLNDVKKGKFEVILVWALDRFSREGQNNMLGYLHILKKAGIGLKSFQEQWFDTTDDGIGQVLMLFVAWMARQERKRIRERTKAGLARARKRGRYPGRPRKSGDTKKRIRRWKKKPPEMEMEINFVPKNGE